MRSESSETLFRSKGGVAMKKVLLLVLVVATAMSSFISCRPLYDENLNWNCDDETFLNVYQPLYLAEIERLALKYGLDFECLIEYEEDNTNKPSVFLYTDTYTIDLELANWYKGARGLCEISLYYYGTEDGFGEYEDFRPCVEFLNDFTNYVAYDTKTDQNHFERLYNEALSGEKNYNGFIYHEDSSVGDVGYSLYLSYEGGYYYMAKRDISIKKDCRFFKFKGLLKPLI